MCFISTTANFNSHAHVERDSCGKVHFHLLQNFNSHAHVERDDYLCSTFDYRRYFNSHAHVERDDIRNTVVLTEGISTHTLTWSVTVSPS